MVNLDEIQNQLESYSNEEKEIFLEFVKPFFEFSDYMKENYGKTMNDIENESAKMSEEVLPEYLSQLENLDETESPLEFMTTISSKIYRRYAESYDYDKGEDLENALTKYMEFILTQELKKRNKSEK